MAEHRNTIDIDASPEVVFPFLVTEKGMTAWMGQWASLEPVPGGSFAVDIAGYPVRGSYLIVDPPRRLVLSWGFAGNESLPPGASTVSFELIEIESGTRLKVVHTDLPDVDVAGHARGWDHFLPRLAVTVLGQCLPPDAWTPRPDHPAPQESQ